MNELWAVTSFFNPQRYRRRLENYHTFRRHLRLPLVAVELALGGPPQLGPADAEILVQLTDGDVMWQKERLLNVGLGRLPPECEKVVWLDADVLVPDDGWADRVRRELDHATLIQPFEWLEYLGADGSPDRSKAPKFPAIASLLRPGDDSRDLFQRIVSTGPDRTIAGMAWAANREWVESVGLYDACVIGGGTTALLFATLGLAAAVTTAQQMNDAQSAYYLAWRDRVADSIGGRVSFTAGTLRHLWHGSLVNRRLAARHGGLAATGFDPAADIAHDGGPWRWSSDKPHLHQLLKNYFAGRREDEVPA